MSNVGYYSGVNQPGISGYSPSEIMASSGQASPYLSSMIGWGSPSYSLANPNAPRFNSGEGLNTTSSYSLGKLGSPDVVQPGSTEGGWGGMQWFDTLDKNGTKTQGALSPMLGAAQGIFNGWLGMQQLGHARNQLNEGKQQFALNYDAQRTTTNAQLEDRQRARVASGSGYQSVGDYMALNGIKPRGG